MIKEVISDTNLREYMRKFTWDDIYTGKILALYQTYGMNRNICKFYVQYNDYAEETVLMAKIGWDYSLARLPKRDTVISEDDVSPEPEPADIAEPDYPEISAFLYMTGAKSIFLSAEMMTGLERYVSGSFLYNCLMEYDDPGFSPDRGDEEFVFPPEMQILDSKNIEHFKLDKIYDILRHDFKIDRSVWLTDLSHRVRHGISTVYYYKESATVTALYDFNNFVYLTQVCTVPENRNKGYAREMLKIVGSYYKINRKKVFLVCRKDMADFYTKSGFRQIGRAANIYSLAPVQSNDIYV